jgi:hypothetical protein
MCFWSQKDVFWCLFSYRACDESTLQKIDHAMNRPCEKLTLRWIDLRWIDPQWGDSAMNRPATSWPCDESTRNESTRNESTRDESTLLGWGPLRQSAPPASWPFFFFGQQFCFGSIFFGSPWKKIPPKFEEPIHPHSYVYEYNFFFENNAKLDFPYDFTFMHSLLVDYFKTMNMDLTPLAPTIVNWPWIEPCDELAHDELTRNESILRWIDLAMNRPCSESTLRW